MKNDNRAIQESNPSTLKILIRSRLNASILKQEEPLDVKILYNDFVKDYTKVEKIYDKKRFEIIGIVTHIGPDIHNKPSIQLSDKEDGENYALCVFNSKKMQDGVKTGDKIICKGNYLVMRHRFGIVLKKSEIVKVLK